MTTLANPRELLSTAPGELGSSSWLTIDQERINGFAECTGDHQWIHTDPERAKDGPFGATIAHGYLTLSLAPVLVAESFWVDNVTAAVNYGLNKVRFPSPVVVGSRVRGHVRLVSAAERGDMIEATLGLTIELEGAPRPACVAEMVVLYS